MMKMFIPTEENEKKVDDKSKFVEGSFGKEVGDAKKSDFKIANGRTLVNLAIDDKDVELLKKLHKNGCPIDNQDDFDRTPLMYAVLNENLECVKYLIENNANINFKNLKRESILRVALETKNYEIIQLLMEHNVNINLKENNEETLIKRIFSLENKELIKGLLVAGINKLDKSEMIEGYYDIFIKYASLANHTMGIESIIELGYPIDFRRYKVRSALMNATIAQHYKTINYMLDFGINFEKEYDILMEVSQSNLCMNGQAKILRKMMEKNPKINYNDKLFEIDLDQLLTFGYIEDVNKVKENGLEIHIECLENLQEDNLEFCNIVTKMIIGDSQYKELELTYDILEQIDSRGRSILHYAACYSDVKFIEVLIEAGIDIEIKDRQQKTAVEYAKEFGNIEIEKYILDYRERKRCNQKKNSILKNLNKERIGIINFKESVI